MTQADRITTGPLTGAEWLARSLAANATTHGFFIDALLRRTLIALDTPGVTRVLAHAETAMACMATGHARIAGRPGICFAQSVGAANPAAGPQDTRHRAAHADPGGAGEGRFHRPRTAGRQRGQPLLHAPLPRATGARTLDKPVAAGRTSVVAGHGHFDRGGRTAEELFRDRDRKLPALRRALRAIGPLEGT
ncbi:MAG: thiamine pyrophosphate-binding protein [Acetobacteraceae bacterium]